MCPARICVDRARRGADRRRRRAHSGLVARRPARGFRDRDGGELCRRLFRLSRHGDGSRRRRRRSTRHRVDARRARHGVPGISSTAAARCGSATPYGSPTAPISPRAPRSSSPASAAPGSTYAPLERDARDRPCAAPDRGVSPSAHDAALAQRRDLGGRIAVRGEHLVAVLAEDRRGGRAPVPACPRI